VQEQNQQKEHQFKAAIASERQINAVLLKQSLSTRRVEWLLSEEKIGRLYNFGNFKDPKKEIIALV
jgi:hypothetical protein